MTTTKLVGERTPPNPCFEQCNKKPESKQTDPTLQMSGICRPFPKEETNEKLTHKYIQVTRNEVMAKLSYLAHLFLLIKHIIFHAN